jgi:hypothetical protein
LENVNCIFKTWRVEGGKISGNSFGKEESKGEGEWKEILLGSTLVEVETAQEGMRYRFISRN